MALIRKGKPAPNGVTKGPIHKVPCPWCGKGLDFRNHADASHGGVGWGEQGLEAGSKVDCDYCKKTSQIHTVQQVTIIKLKQSRG